MSVVGADPEQLLALLAAMQRAVDELAAIRSADPAATGPMSTVADVRHRLTGRWEPAVRRVLALEALVDGTFARDVPVIDIDLQVLDLLDDPELAERLVEWADDPTMPDELRARWTDADWATIADALGTERLDVASALVDDPDDPVGRQRLAELDAALVVVASMYAGGRHDGHVRWRPTVVDLVAPSTAALMLPGFGLDDVALGELAARVLARERARQTGSVPWPDAFEPGDDAGDLVFRYLATRPAAAGAFLEVALGQPDIVFLTAEHDDTVAAVLIAGTGPDLVDATTAGARLAPLIAWARDHDLTAAGDGVVSAPAAVLAGAVAPWLLQFGPRAAEWGWDDEQGDAALRWVVADDSAMAALTDAIGTWRLSMTEVPLLLADGRVDLARLDELTAMFDQVGRAVRDAQLGDAAAARFFFEAGVFVGTLFLSAVVPGGVAASMAGDAVLAVAVPAATSLLAGWGLAPSAEADGSAARAGFGSWVSDASVAAVVAFAAQAIADGRLPSDALDDLDLDDLAGDCRPAEVDDRLRRFVRQVGERTDAATANGLAAVLNAFSNRQTVGEACGR